VDEATDDELEAEELEAEELEAEELEAEELEAEELPLFPPVHGSSPIGVCAISASTSFALSTQRLSPLNNVMLSL
jgi:hypothetical protein